jgi:hypothetical protein
MTVEHWTLAIDMLIRGELSPADGEDSDVVQDPQTL